MFPASIPVRQHPSGASILEAMTTDPLLADTILVPCRGGPHGVGWLRVATPPPFEVDREGHGIYVLDDADSDFAGGAQYVWVPYGL